MRFSEEAKRGIRLQLELMNAVDENAIKYFEGKLVIYEDFQSKGMKGFSLMLDSLAKRIAKIKSELDERKQLMLEYQKAGLI